MNRKTLIAGAAGALALAGTVAIAQTAQQPADPAASSSADTYNNQAPSADTAATDTAATTAAGERG